MAPRYLDLDLLKHAMRNMIRFVCVHIQCEVLSRWNPPSGAVEMATVTSAPGLLFKMMCMFFSTVRQ